MADRCACERANVVLLLFASSECVGFCCFPNQLNRVQLSVVKCLGWTRCVYWFGDWIKSERKCAHPMLVNRCLLTVQNTHAHTPNRHGRIIVDDHCRNWEDTDTHRTENVPHIDALNQNCPVFGGALSRSGFHSSRTNCAVIAFSVYFKWKFQFAATENHSASAMHTWLPDGWKEAGNYIHTHTYTRFEVETQPNNTTWLLTTHKHLPSVIYLYFLTFILCLCLF